MKDKTTDKLPHVTEMAFDNNPNIGLYAYATDDYCLIGEEIPERFAEEISKHLQVPVYRLNIAGTSLTGVFCAGNSKMLVVPHIIQDEEKKKLDELRIPYTVVKTKITALGNNITANDNGAVVSTDFTDETIDILKKALGTEVKRGKVSELDNVGSCLIVTNKGGLVHRDIKSFELEFLEDLLQVEILDGTVNMGNPYVKSGIIANAKGFIIGSHSGGPEITNADMAFGFIE